MKRIVSAALTLVLLCCAVCAAHATELKVKGSLDIYGLWSANIVDFDSDSSDADNYMVTQRMRTYFTFIANENLKAVLGLEMDTDWGYGDNDWGTDLNNNDIEIKHTYVDFNFPDTKVNVKAGMLPILLPGIFGNPVFFDDAPAVVVSSPVTDVVGLTVGYTRGIDGSTSFDSGASATDSDDMDMAFIVAPVTLDKISITPYFGYVWIGDNVSFTGHQALSSSVKNKLVAGDDASVWYAGANVKVDIFNPLTFEADLIYGEGENEDYETKGWYTDLAATYNFDVLTATLFGTYATGGEDDADEDNFIPALAQTWMMTPYIGGARAFSTGYSNKGYATDALGVGRDGTGLWSVGLTLDKISFVDNLSHKLTFAYARGTSEEGSGFKFTGDDSISEVYLVNTYKIYQNLNAINEVGFCHIDNDELDNMNNSYFTSLGFQYKF